MQAWQVHHYGEPGEMTLDEVDKPSPGEGEVLIRNHAAGLNFFDILQAQGKYQSKPSFPFTIGGEVAGTIEAAGPGVSRWSPGERVLCLTQGGGGYAEYSLGKAARTFPIPVGNELSRKQPRFRWYIKLHFFALRNRGQLQQGEWLLVHAGASGVGMAAIQIGKAFGDANHRHRGKREEVELLPRAGRGSCHQLPRRNLGRSGEADQRQRGGRDL